MGENVTVKTKSLTSNERYEHPGLINGGVAHFIRLVFWGESNGHVTLGTPQMRFFKLRYKRGKYKKHHAFKLSCVILSTNPPKKMFVPTI